MFTRCSVVSSSIRLDSDKKSPHPDADDEIHRWIQELRVETGCDSGASREAEAEEEVDDPRSRILPPPPPPPPSPPPVPQRPWKRQKTSSYSDSKAVLGVHFFVGL